MRDHMPPVRLLFSRLTPADFFHTYGVRLMTEEERGEDPEATEPARELLTLTLTLTLTPTLTLTLTLNPNPNQVSCSCRTPCRAAS